MGQLQVETMGQPGLLGLWILDKKVNTRSSRSGDGEIFFAGCRKRKKAVLHFFINSRFIHLIKRFYLNAWSNSHSRLSAY